MQEPENIVANWTYGDGNTLYASSRDNVLDSASYDHTGGLASCRAVTSWQLPGWNCLKHREVASARIWFADEGECRTTAYMVKTVSADEFRYVSRRNSPVYRQRHGSRDWNENREVPSTISDISISVTREVRYVRVAGMTHGVVVAVTPVITSRRSQGPLDHDGHLQREVDGVLPAWLSSSGCTGGPQSVGHKTSAVQSFQFSGVYDEVCSKPQGKAAHERHGLKPDTGNRSVRDFRGLGGNGCVAVFQPTGGMPWVNDEIRQYGTNRATVPLGISKELRRRKDMLFTFLKHPGVPWHNNDAENAIRQGVLHRKVSGGRRTWEGADSLQCILSVYRTSLKKGINFTELVLRSLVSDWFIARIPQAVVPKS